ncbi:MAG: hypothetical protein ACE15C_04875 [Phycisphaerae bacterium]
MTQQEQAGIQLPPASEVRQAVLLYIQNAYAQDAPETTKRFVPPDGFDPAAWLMSDIAERDPANAPLDAVRSFALRIGNAMYPHMKLRLSRPPKDQVFLFSVDSHDAFLSAPPGSSDHLALEELKRHNAAVSARISAAWDAAGLPTERNYLRRKVAEARVHAAEEMTIPPSPGPKP